MPKIIIYFIKAADITKNSKTATKPKEEPNEVKVVMTNSYGSVLDGETPTTPTDSGVQLLDSESDLNESMISSSGFEFETCADVPGTSSEEPIKDMIPDLLLPVAAETILLKTNALTRSDIDNNNDDDLKLNLAVGPPDITSSICDASMISSTHSTFDAENTEIVYRRRVKKPSKAAPKKRVSFHEDILKNTRTDNIHIEHGFVTYKGKNVKPKNTRYSWCSEYDNEGFEDDHDDNSQYVYRNACSEVLDYGKTTDVLDEEEGTYTKYDNSGVFEYGSTQNPANNRFYKCSCSSSNSSIESGSSGSGENQSDNTTNTKTNDKHNYKQSKSNSCDCIGTNTGNVDIGKGTCYFSEPNIERSVWSKEKKPKSSCLKKTKRTYQTNVVPEYQLKNNVKKFNVHQLSSDIIIDNSKIIIGSLKDIFGITLPERGVPEGSEDLNTVTECIPFENNDYDFTILHKPCGKSNTTKNPKLSKSLDGGLANKGKRFVHNVDQQLRRQNDDDLYAPSNNNSRKNSLKTESSVEDDKEAAEGAQADSVNASTNFRNKFIINCESTVFEHTGTCFETESSSPFQDMGPADPPISRNPFKKKLSNIFKSFTSNSSNVPSIPQSTSRDLLSDSVEEISDVRDEAEGEESITVDKVFTSNTMESSITSTISDRNSSIISDITPTSSGTSATTQNDSNSSRYDYLKMIGEETGKKSRHLSSPLRKKRSDCHPSVSGRMSPDLFNSMGRDFMSNSSHSSKATALLSEEFDDILTITTDNTDKTDDIVIVDYADVKNDIESNQSGNNYYLKLPSIMTSSTTSTASKTSLINRFLRNVTQKKILEATIKKNNFFQAKLKNERKLFGGNLYVKGVKPKDDSLIKDLNAEIAMEIEMGSNSFELNDDQDDMMASYSVKKDFRFDGGVGEVRAEMFDVSNLQLLRSKNEILMKVYKLYTGYSNDGHMVPVLVFLTDQTLYVIDLVRNKLCNKFVLPYSELDVILMGPYGNTVLLSNNARDMQQVLLAGGPYPADKLVSSLELCARRGGSILPAVGQLTLDHLAPLRSFVCSNSSISKDDAWKYYAVVNIPAGSLGVEQEPLGPNLQGPLMHRSLSHSGVVQQWSAGYFLLKAGVLYLFNDSTQKIPNWAVSLIKECQGARRCLHTNRPHCFEILLRTGSLQLAAPDEYVASDWLQSLVQSASGLFEMQERHKTLGCTLIMTSNHLITLREDFSSPLRRIVPQAPVVVIPTPAPTQSTSKENFDPNIFRKMSSSTILDTSSEVSS